MTKQNYENADIFCLRQEGIETKVTEHHESETEDPTRVSSSFVKQHKALKRYYLIATITHIHNN